MHVNWNFIEACGAGNLQLAQTLFNMGVDINEDDYRAARRASGNGHLPIIQWMHKVGLDAQGCDHAFSTSCSFGHIEIARWLLEIGVNIEAQKSGLLYACDSGHLELAQYLHETGIETDFDRAMSCAAAHGHLNIVQWLFGIGIVSGIDLALGRASSWGHYNVIEWLLETGADIRAHNNLALSMACQNGRLDVAQWLFNKGAEPQEDMIDAVMQTIHETESCHGDLDWLAEQCEEVILWLKSILRRLDLDSYVTDKSEVSPQICPICYEELQLKVVKLPCSHQFDIDCIVLWVKEQSNCPVCRRII